MPRTLLKSGLQSKKYKPKIEQEVNNIQSNSLSNLQAISQKFLSGNGFFQNN